MADCGGRLWWSFQMVVWTLFKSAQSDRGSKTSATPGLSPHPMGFLSQETDLPYPPATLSSRPIQFTFLLCSWSVNKSCLTLWTPWTVAHWAPLSKGFPGKNTGVGCHFLLQGNLPNPVSKAASPVSPALAGRYVE